MRFLKLRYINLNKKILWVEHSPLALLFFFCWNDIVLKCMRSSTRSLLRNCKVFSLCNCKFVNPCKFSIISYLSQYINLNKSMITSHNFHIIQIKIIGEKRVKRQTLWTLAWNLSFLWENRSPITKPVYTSLQRQHHNSWAKLQQNKQSPLPQFGTTTSRTWRAPATRISSTTLMRTPACRYRKSFPIASSGGLKTPWKKQKPVTSTCRFWWARCIIAVTVLQETPTR